MMGGLYYKVDLELYSGSLRFDDNQHRITINSPTYLVLKAQLTEDDDDEGREIELAVPRADQFARVNLSFHTFSNLNQHYSGKMMEHMLVLCVPWCSQSQEVTLHYIPPFKIDQSLQTCKGRKFVQVTVHGNGPEIFLLSHQRLDITGIDKRGDRTKIPVTSFQDGDQQIPVLRDQNAFYLWSLDDEASHSLVNGGLTTEASSLSPSSTSSSSITNSALTMECHFTINYTCNRSNILEAPTKTYSHYFSIQQHTTLYTVCSKVEPGPGTSFCRAGNMCRLNIDIERVKPSKKLHSTKCLMYEVVADHTLWVPCGKTAAVVQLPMSGERTHHITLDVMPLVTGYLPVPLVRLSKYYPARCIGKTTSGRGGEVDGLRSGDDGEVEGGGGQLTVNIDQQQQISISMTTPSPGDEGPKLELLGKSQVYNRSRGEQVHVLPAMTSNVFEVAAMTN